MEESQLWAMYMMLCVLYEVEERKDAGWTAEGESGRKQSNQNITVRKRASPLRLQLLLNRVIKHPNPARPRTHYFNTALASAWPRDNVRLIRL